MSFYANISKYYEYIFPVREPQKKFFKQHLDALPNEKVLDIACGTGSHTRELKKQGFTAIGIDLDKQVIEKAQEEARKEGSDVKFTTANMLDLPFADNEFAGVICIGNSLVHLLTEADIRQAIKEMYRVLTSGGKLILQIVNYNRILDNNLKGLPPVENNEVGLRFERNYEFLSDQTINFNTILKVPEGEFMNTVKLRPLRKELLNSIVSDTGFVNLEYYGSFQGDQYNANAFATILVCEK